MESHIYFVTHGGFDTHSNQGGRHANLLGRLADDVRADVEFGLDFRRVYAAVIREWLGADPARVVGAGYEPLGII